MRHWANDNRGWPGYGRNSTVSPKVGTTLESKRSPNVIPMFDWNLGCVLHDTFGIGALCVSVSCVALDTVRGSESAQRMCQCCVSFVTSFLIGGTLLMSFFIGLFTLLAHLTNQMNVVVSFVFWKEKACVLVSRLVFIWILALCVCMCLLETEQNSIRIAFVLTWLLFDFLSMSKPLDNKLRQSKNLLEALSLVLCQRN